MRAIEAGLRVLAARGVDQVFGIPAGSINALYDALHDITELNHIIAKHEGIAGYMATAYSRIKGLPSLCVASSGPGATNLVTPVANAWKEKIPLIIITGAVPRKALGHGGAQEMDAEPIFKSITKLSTTILDPEKLPELLAHAFDVAVSGVPGPVHLAIPIDVQMSDIGEFHSFYVSPSAQVDTNGQNHLLLLQELRQLISDSGDRGVMLLGHGAKVATRDILQLAEWTGWKVATTPRGKGAFPEDHPLSLGVYGLAGHPQAMAYLNSPQCDLLLVIGSSLGELATANWDQRLTQGKKIVQIDMDEKELGKNIPLDLAIHGRAEHIVSELVHLLQMTEQKHTYSPAVSYQSQLLAPEIASAELENETETSWNTQIAMSQLSACAPANTRFCVDIGELMTYAIQNLCIRDAQQFDININFGGMGSGIGSALGASLADPQRPTLCITGDGSFFMHGMDILTAKEYNLPITFVVINNARLGMVYHGHMMQYKRCADDFSQNRVNIAQVAKTLGIPSVQVNNLQDMHREHVSRWLQHDGPLLVEIIVSGEEVPPMGERVKFLQGATY